MFWTTFSKILFAFDFRHSKIKMGYFGTLKKSLKKVDI